MESNRNTQLFREIDPPRGLFSAILARIAQESRRAARFRLAMFSTVVVASGAALIPTLSYTMQEFRVSGFYDYVSLLFSDYTVASAHWQEISLSVVESLPSVAILLILSISITLIWSLRRAVPNARIAVMPVRHA